MASSRAATVAAYLAEFPPERRAVVRAVRALVRKSLPRGYREGMEHGMIAWQVPLSVCAETYNGRPLLYAALAAQKQYYALYLMAPYVDPAAGRALAAAWRRAGKRLDMGKSCLRFRSLEDLVPEAVSGAVAAMAPAAFAAVAEGARGRSGRGAPARGRAPRRPGRSG